MYSFGFSGGLRERRFSLKSTLSREILQRVRFIMYAHLALQATLFTYRTLFRFRYADPIIAGVGRTGSPAMPGSDHRGCVSLSLAFPLFWL